MATSLQVVISEDGSVSVTNSGSGSAGGSEVALQADTLVLLRRDVACGQANDATTTTSSLLQVSLSIDDTQNKKALEMEEKEKAPDTYFTKWLGTGAPRPAVVPRTRIAWSFIGAFIGILALSSINYLVLGDQDLVAIVGSFGAHAVLVFAAPDLPLAQPWNAIMGNVVSAVVGVSAFKLVGQAEPEENVVTWLGESGMNWIAAPLAVSVAIVCMFFTASLHPPGGAIALIACIGSSAIKRTGYWYVLMPSLLSSVIQCALAVLVNNCSRDEKRRYPVRWMPGMFCPPKESA